MEQLQEIYQDTPLGHGRLFIKQLTSSAIVPTKERDSDEGYDVYADENITIPMGRTKKVSTGIAGYATSIRKFITKEGEETEVHGNDIWLQVESRSGMSIKGIFTVGGIIDTSYRGEIGIVLANMSGEDYVVTKGDKIAQIVLREHISVPIQVVTELNSTDRGSKGFGSSGK